MLCMYVMYHICQMKKSTNPQSTPLCIRLRRLKLQHFLKPFKAQKYILFYKKKELHNFF